MINGTSSPWCWHWLRGLGWCRCSSCGGGGWVVCGWRCWRRGGRRRLCWDCCPPHFLSLCCSGLWGLRSWSYWRSSSSPTSSRWPRPPSMPQSAPSSSSTSSAADRRTSINYPTHNTSFRLCHLNFSLLIKSVFPVKLCSVFWYLRWLDK